jgi:prophage regulatory protein
MCNDICEKHLIDPFAATSMAKVLECRTLPSLDLMISNGLPMSGGASAQLESVRTSTPSTPKRDEKSKASKQSGVTASELGKSTSSNSNSGLRIMRLKEVIKRVGLSRSSIYNLMSNNDFPQKVSLGSRAIGFFEHDIYEWLGQRGRAA